MPESQVALRACTVSSRDKHGRPMDVDYEVDARVKTMKYTLRHSYDEPHRINGEYLDGDFKYFAGEWLMEKTASGGTNLTFNVGIDPGARVPAHIARTLNQQILHESVEQMKTEVEQRLPGAPGRARLADVRARVAGGSSVDALTRSVVSRPGDAVPSPFRREEFFLRFVGLVSCLGGVNFDDPSRVPRRGRGRAADGRTGRSVPVRPERCGLRQDVASAAAFAASGHLHA
ncbi:MAG: SRPBCC family protein [Solirubrobacteraceae bacterium]